MNILITGVGGPTPRSFAICLKKYSAYSNYNLIATDVNPLSLGLYRKDLFAKSYLVPRATDPNYWEVIQNIVSENKIELAVVLPEIEVLTWSRRDKEGKLPCKALLPDPNMVDILIDKSKMTEVLNEIGLVPKSFPFRADDENLERLFRNLELPFWVRSSAGTSGLGSMKIDSLEALRTWITINPSVSRFLASQFLPGRNLACKVLYYQGKVLRAACVERVNYIMAKVAPSGITGNTSFGRFLNEPELVKAAQMALDYLFERTGSRKNGFYTVDFKEDAKGKPLITEINVRHVAFTQCFAAAGANFAEDTIRLLSNDNSFNPDFKIYEFEPDLIFLRDVDSNPIIMKEGELLRENMA